MGLKYYAIIEDETLYEIMRQASIDYDNKLMEFYGSIGQ